MHVFFFLFFSHYSMICVMRHSIQKLFKPGLFCCTNTVKKRLCETLLFHLNRIKEKNKHYLNNSRVKSFVNQAHNCIDTPKQHNHTRANTDLQSLTTPEWFLTLLLQ